MGLTDDQLKIGGNVEDLPTLSVPGLPTARINNAGIQGFFERGVEKPTLITDYTLQADATVGDFVQSYFGKYVLRHLFQNLKGVSADIWVSRLIPVGADNAKLVVNNANASPSYNLEAGRKGQPDVGTWGNRLRVLFIPSPTPRSFTYLTAPTVAGNNPTIQVESVAPFYTQDVVKISNGATSFLAIVAGLDEQQGLIALETNVGVVIPSGSKVETVSFDLKIFLKDKYTGAISLKETWTYLSPISGAFNYILDVINNKDDGSDFILIKQTVTPEYGTILDFPVYAASDLANLALPLVGGVDGDPTALTPAEMAAKLPKFDGYNITWLGSCESFTESMFDLGEAYTGYSETGQSRQDCIWIGSPSMNLSYDALTRWANKRQKNRLMYGVPNQTWVLVDDPLSKAANPVKAIPNIGAIIGFAIQHIARRGAHKVIASTTDVLVGIRGLVSQVGAVELNGIIPDMDLVTKLQNAGLNTITLVNGEYCIRSAATPSTKPQYLWSNVLTNRIFHKKTFKDAFVDMENEVGGDDILNYIEFKLTTFAKAYHAGSSNQGSEPGYPRDLTLSEVVNIIVKDPTLNTAASLAKGIAKAKYYFMSPPPALKFLTSVGDLEFKIKK